MPSGAVAGSPHLGRLTTLSLSCYGLGAENFAIVEGVRALATSPYLRRLTTLRLARCGLEDEAGEVLAASDNLTGLKTLDLRSNHLTGEMKGRLRARFGDRVRFK